MRTARTKLMSAALVWILLLLVLGTEAVEDASSSSSTASSSAGKVAKISTVSPTKGSLEGGTLLTIAGVNFETDLYASQSQAFVGTEECKIKEFYSGSNKIVCVCPPSPIEREASVTLYQKGKRVLGNGEAFAYKKQETPRVKSIGPNAVEVGGYFTISVDTVWFHFDRYTKNVKYDGQNTIIHAGDYLLEHEDFESAWTSASGGPSGNRLELRVRAPRVAGHYNVTLEFLEPKQGTRAWIPDSLYSMSSAGHPFVLSVYPSVTGMSHASGSANGGQVLTITGKGFGKSAEKVKVRNTGGDLDCEITPARHSVAGTASTSLDDGRIVCETTALVQSGGNGSSTLFEKGFGEEYFCEGNCIGWGGRGVLLERWDINSSVNDLETLQQVVKARPADSTSVVQNAGFRTPEAYSGGLRLTSVFLPPETTNYFLQAKAYNYGERKSYKTLLSLGFPNATRWNVTSRYSNDWQHWNSLLGKRVESVYLEEGVPVMVQALSLPAHGRKMDMEVGGFVPTRVGPSIASAPAIQTIRVRSQAWGPIVSFKFEGFDLDLANSSAFVYPTGNIFAGATVKLNSTAAQVKTAMKKILDTKEDFSVKIQSTTVSVNVTTAAANATATNYTSVSVVSRNKLTLSWKLTFPTGSEMFRSSRDGVTWTVQTENSGGSLVVGENVTAGYVVSRNHSTPLGGTFDIAVDTTNGTWSGLAGVPFDASSNEIERRFAEIGIDARVASRWGNDETGFFWRTELPRIQSLWVPKPLSLNLTGIQGENIEGLSYVDIATTTDALETPLRSDILRLPKYGFQTTESSILEVEIDGVLAGCPGRNCTYTTHSTGIPDISSVDPQKVAPGEILKISGSGFGETLQENQVVVVSADAEECMLQSASATELRCRVGNLGTSGNKTLYVSVGNNGSSKRISVEFDYTLLSDFTPKSISGDGQTWITVTGQGFSADCSSNQVQVGSHDFACPVCSTTKLECLLGPLPGPYWDLTVAVDSVPSTFADKLSINENEYGISGFSPETLPASGGTLSVSGKFDATSISKVTLASSSEEHADVDCAVETSAEVSLTCSVLPGIMPGKYHVMLTTGGRTLQSSSKLGVELLVTSVSPAKGSLAGGTILTIAGQGFSAGSEVLLSVPVSTTHPNGLQACDVQSISAGAITCKTRSYCSANASPEDPAAKVCQYREPEKPSQVTVIQCPSLMKNAFGQKYSTSDDLGRLLCWASESTFHASCADCIFKYEENSTLLVQSVYPSAGSGGEQVYLSGLWPDAGATVVSLQGDSNGLGYSCGSVQAVNSSFLSCALPDMEAGLYTFDAAGDAGAALSQTKFMAYNKISLTANVREFSLAGGGLLEIHSSDALFNTRDVSKNVITVGGLPCNVSHVESKLIKCIVPDGSSLSASVADFKLFSQTLAATVEANINGVNATCSQEENCDITYSAARTPYISHRSFAFATTHHNLTIVGDFGLDGTETLSIQVGNFTYQGASWRAGQDFATFSVSKTLPAGHYDVKMGNQAGDYAAWSSTELKQVTILPRVTDVQPQRGSVHGGTILTVSGSGFPQCDSRSSCATPVRLLASSTDTRQVRCEVLESTGESIKCLLQPADFNLAADAELTLTELSFEPGQDKTLQGTATVAFDVFSYAVDSVTPTTAYKTTDVTVGCSNCGHLASSADARRILLRSARGDLISSSDFTFDSSNSRLTFKLEDFSSIVSGEYQVGITSNSSSGNSELGPDVLTVPLTVLGVNSTQGTRGGGQILRLTGEGFADFETFAEENLVKVGSRNCTQISADQTEIRCRIAPPSSAEEEQVDTPQNIRVKTPHMEDFVVSGMVYSFLDSLTPRIRSVDPVVGSTEGGTQVTIVGEGFNQMEGLPTISFGSTGSCTRVAMTVNATHDIVTCTTLPIAKRAGGPHQIFLDWHGLGYATGNFSFFQADFWSQPTTWGGEDPPEEGDSVVVPQNTTVLLDVSTPALNLVVIEGELVWAGSQEELELQAKYIFLHKGGKLTIGTEDEPYAGKAAITMHGDRNSQELPLYGAKMIAVREGYLDLHGEEKRPVWTKLTETANPGDTSIHVSGPVNWKVGDKIVVASSSLKPDEAEEAVIASLSEASGENSVVRIDITRPLNFTHLGVEANFDGEVIDMRAEVGCLSRNVMIRGDADFTSSQRYGPHIFVHDHRTGNCLSNNADECGVSESYLRMEHVEMENCGQSSRLGRYCIHFHMHGDAQRSYLKGNSVHHSFHRAVAVHGTHRLRLLENIAYNIEGHAYFLEDGIETENVFEGNIGIWARRSHSSLNTDTSPAVFWITNPMNYFRGNVAAGSDGYGFWFRLRDAPDGASVTTAPVCPKYSPLGEFDNNTAHSCDKYGLRIFEEWFPCPLVHACKKQWWRSDHTTGQLKNFVAYKNGMKGAIATSVGRVQFHGFKVADNGAGPNAHVVNGKDHGGGVEFTWNQDHRKGPETPLSEMAGLHDSLVVAKSSEGFVGTAGYWPSSRGIRGLITQSPKPITSTAILAVSNVTFYGFTDSDPQFFALEACGKCKDRQGAASTYFEKISMKGTGMSEKPAITSWTWAHQGVFVDTDGSLIGQECDNSGCTTVPGGSIVASNGLLRDSECRDFPAFQNVGGKVCRPEIRHTRVMVDEVRPHDERHYDMKVWQEGNGCPLNEFNSSICETRVPYQKWNNHGHSFHVISGRNYTLEIGSPYRTDYTRFRILGQDRMPAKESVILKTRYQQSQDHFKVNGAKVSSDVPLLEGNVHGSFFYDKGRVEYNPEHNATDTVLSVLVSDYRALRVEPSECPEVGCDVYEGGSRNGTFLFSEEVTWRNCSACFPNQEQLDAKMRSGIWFPKDMDEVFIPVGMKVVLDVSSPVLRTLHVRGEFTFSEALRTTTLSLNSYFVLVEGSLTVGTPDNAYVLDAAINLFGTRSDPFLPLADWSMGGKVLSSLNGGKISLHGKDFGRRWVKMDPAAKGTNTITLAEPVSWLAGQEILVTSASWNPWEREIYEIEGVQNGGRTLVLKGSLRFDHLGSSQNFGDKTLDTRAEVGLMSSNIRVGSADAADQYNGLVLDHPQYRSQAVSWQPNATAQYICHPSQNPAYCKFGCQIICNEALLQIQNVAVGHCGQAGLENGAVTFNAPEANSYIQKSSVVYSMEGAVKVRGNGKGVRITGNFIYESLDASAVVLENSGNHVQENLVAGVMKMDKSKHDFVWPAGVEDKVGGNAIASNVVAGSDRIGFYVVAGGCSSSSAAAFKDNVAHSCVVGVMLRASGTGCSLISRSQLHHNWDFGILGTVRGLPENIVVENNVISDTKYVGLRLLRKAGMTEEATATVSSNVFVSRSSEQECLKCSTGGDTGCHMQTSTQSYRIDSREPSYGMLSFTSSLSFSPGPEKKPWDKEMGYPVVQGIAYLNDNVFAHYDAGDGSNCGVERYAFGNDGSAADAFHPHLFRNTTWVGLGSTRKVKLTGPDPMWRNPSDCGVATFDCADPIIASSSAYCTDGNSVATIPLNCQGPKHVILTDLDGTFAQSGGPSFIMGHASSAGPRKVFDQGTITTNPTCKSFGVDAVECSVEASRNSQPPQMLVIESRDADTETRNFSPLILEQESSKMSDLLVNTMDHGWCFGYTCQKRLSTFWTNVETNDEYSLHFTGTPSKMLRLWLPYAAGDSQVILKINYLSAGRRFVWQKGSGRVMPLKSTEECIGRGGGFLSEEVKATCVPRLGDGTPHGSFFWHQSAGVLYVKLTGSGKSLEVRTEAVVQVSAKLDMNFADFYEERYIENMASLLDIDPSRIKIVSVIPGSVIIDMIILQDPKTLEESGLYDDIPENTIDESGFVDPEDSRAGDSLTDEDAGGDASPPPPPPPPPPQDSTTANSVLENMEALQKQVTQEISQKLEEAAASGMLQKSLEEAYPEATYMALATSTGAVDDEEEESQSGGTSNIIIGEKQEGTSILASDSKGIPDWLIYACVFTGLLFCGVGSLYVARIVKERRARTVQGPLQDKMTLKPKRIGTVRKQGFGKLFSFRNKDLFEQSAAHVDMGDVKLEMMKAENESQEDGLIRYDDLSSLRVDNPLVVVAVESSDMDLYDYTTNPLPGPSSSDEKPQQDQPPSPLPEVITKPVERERGELPDVVVTKKPAVRQTRDSKRFSQLVSLGTLGSGGPKASVATAFEDLEREKEKREREETERKWRRDQSLHAVEASVSRALEEVEKEERSSVVAVRNEDGKKELVDVDNPVFTRTNSEVADDEIRARTYRAHAHRAQQSVAALGKVNEDIGNPVFTRTNSEAAEEALMARANTAKALQISVDKAIAEVDIEDPPALPRTSSEVAKEALDSRSYSKIEDSVAKALAELSEEEDEEEDTKGKEGGDLPTKVFIRRDSFDEELSRYL
ncbi:fibrocystin-L [Chloropicon primus]|uniref:G8 domain-containing protein n=2 Tax=Chloropicon primus TaxID=1764295 RepID=A0A5B8MZ44_9CHLO|nr:hypothetical protein A3770_14p73180 [Chloropicon primus]UPR04009.1 fibrocystin-L [Chloropicon primus]|eukprot:QDZ24800.1 hypothetical protein A3770_14p73180 [Chloropicon primus]